MAKNDSPVIKMTSNGKQVSEDIKKYKIAEAAKYAKDKLVIERRR